MLLATNKALIRRWIETGLNTGDWDVIGDCFSPAYASSNMRGTADLERSLATIRTAFPDLRVQIEELIAEGDQVMARLAYQGTHQGPFFRHAPSGSLFSWSGIAIYRVADGRIIEEWAIWDQTFFFKLSGSF